MLMLEGQCWCAATSSEAREKVAWSLQAGSVVDGESGGSAGMAGLPVARIGLYVDSLAARACTAARSVGGRKVGCVVSPPTLSSRRLVRSL